jgi:hypothetical protein
MNTFRELFDQRDRDEIVSALGARRNIQEAHVRKLRNAERSTNAVAKLEEHEQRLDLLNDLITRVCAECD